MLTRSLLVLSICTIPLQAQTTSQAGGPRSPSSKKALPIPDYARWRTIGTPSISTNGAWVAFAYTQLRRDDQLHVKQVDGDKEYVVERASRPVISDDARWVAYAVAPPKP